MNMYTHPVLVIFGYLLSFGLGEIIESTNLRHHHHVSKVQAINQASFVVKTTEKSKFKVYILSSECYQCHATHLCNVNEANNCSKSVDARWPLNVTVISEKNYNCSFTKHFGTSGEYVLNVQVKNSVLNCKLKTLKEPVNIYFAILTTVCVFMGLAFLIQIFKVFYHKGFFNGIIQIWKNATYTNLTESQNIANSSSSYEENKLPIKVKKRLQSLDAFRGISLIIMIFVNYGGGGYWFFKHSPWNGLTVADLVFPWFMWIMGVSMTFSLKSQMRRCLPSWIIFMKIAKRSLILFSLGIIMNSNGKSSQDTLRIPGVLQRFGISYFVVSTIELVFTKAGDVAQQHWYSFGETVKDKVKYFIEWMVILIFPTIHTIITFKLPISGCPTGYIGPGGLKLSDDVTNCTGGAAGYIDRMTFGHNHIYQSPTCKDIYDTILPYDPEGLLGTLNSIFLVFLGVKAGKILIMHQCKKVILSWWMCWFFITGLIAGALCRFSQNEGIIPVNKNLWSLSFVLLMASFAFLLLSILYVVIDAKSWWNGSPFLYAGMNSILIYVGSEITGKMFPWTWHTNDTHWENLFCNIFGTFLWVLISFWLYIHRFFLSI